MTSYFSLSRLSQHFMEQSLTEIIHVGGRYEMLDHHKPVLTSGDLVLLLPRELNAQVGDLVVISARGSEFMLSTESTFVQQHPLAKKILNSSQIRSFKVLKNFEEQVVFHLHNRVETPSAQSASAASARRGAQNASEWPLAPNPFEKRLWGQFLFQTRSYFIERGLIEATTPSLVSNPGMEPELEPFSTVWRHGSQHTQYFLPTSPELHLKQLLVQGFTDIFEIKTVFRNEEQTEIHTPEFSMLEWYRGFADLEWIRKDLWGLLNYLSEKVFLNNIQFEKCTEYSVADFFAEKLKFELTPQTSKSQLWTLANELGLQPSTEFTWNDLFHLIWVAKIENQIPHEPFLLKDYPPSQAALAKINSRGWADRFEFYWQGVEIANAFNELNDPIEQRKRFEKDQKLRVQYGRTPLNIDEQFMRSLERGLPPSGGIALGMDRLFRRFMNHCC